MNCTQQKLKTLRDEHGFTPAKLKAAKKYLQGKEYWENNNAIADSVIEDSGMFMELMYRKGDKELDVINESIARNGKAQVYVHGVTKDFAVVTYPDGVKGYTYPLDKLTVDDVNMKTFLRKE